MSKSKTKTSNTSTTSSTSTPTVAPWLNQGYQDYSGLIGKYASSDPSQYVASANPTQTKAIESAQNLGGWQQGLDQAGQLVSATTKSPIATASSGGVTAASIGQNEINRFLNPYLQNVVDTTLADYDVESGRTRASQAASAAKNQAFGGSRFALREAQTEGELARGRASADANLRSDAYKTALQYANSEAERRQAAALASYQGGLQTSMFNAGQQNAGLDRNLSAAGLLGNFATAGGDQSRADVDTQLTAGGQQYAIDQAKAQALPDWLKNIGNLYGSIPTSAFTSINQTGSGQSTGKTTTTGASIGDLQTAMQMAAAFSDERLKENIEFDHKDDAGRNWYTYNYIWDERPKLGVMAQEILETDPNSVILDDSGFYKVDYGTLR